MLNKTGCYSRRIGRLLRSCLAEDYGQEILEAAIVLPILFLILLAIFWFGRAFNISSTLNRAARQGIQTASQYTCAECGNSPQGAPQIFASIINTLQADHLYSANLVSYTPPFSCVATPPPNCTTYQNIQICTGVPLTCGTASCEQPPVACGANPALGVRLTFGYQYNWALNLANLAPLTLHGVAQSGSEN